MKNKLREKSGETLVEVLASMFIFLILFGILQGAISYSHASLEKNKEIRARNAQIIQSLASAEKTDGETVTLSFMATTSEMDQKGSVVFRVPLVLATRTALYTDANGQNQTMVFPMYDSVLPQEDASGQSAASDGGNTP